MLLLRFLKINEFDAEKAQQLLVLNLEVREQNPVLFLNRDILSEELQQAARTMTFIPMSKPTSKLQNVNIMHLADEDPNSYDVVGITRLIHAIFDARFVMCEGSELTCGEIGICDMKGFSFRHMLKAIRHTSIMSGHMKYSEEAMPTKIIQNHFINCSSIVHRLMTIFKPFMKQETIDTIKFHVEMDTLYEYVPRELLPNEYGGTAGSLSDLHDEWQEKLLTKR